MKNTTIKGFIEHWEDMSGAYFWSWNTNAASRASKEAYYSRELKFSRGKKRYECFIHVTSSRSNVYVEKSVYVDGEKKTIRALKALIK